MALSPLADTLDSEELRYWARRIDTDFVQDLMLGMVSHSEFIVQASDVPVGDVAEWQKTFGVDGLNRLLGEKARYNNLTQITLTSAKQKLAIKMARELAGAFRVGAYIDSPTSSFAVLLLLCGVGIETVVRWGDEGYDLRNAMLLVDAGVSGATLENAVSGGVDIDILTSAAKRF